MNPLRREQIEVVACGLFLILLAVCHTHLLARGLDRIASRHAHAFQSPLIGLLEKAHAERDDLTSQRILTALAQSPGVGMAAVVDRNNLVLAHTDPAKIGKLVARDPQMIATPLGDRTSPWGTLIISYSNPLYRDLKVRQGMGWILGVALILAAQIVRSAMWVNRLNRQARQLSELIASSDHLRRQLDQAKQQEGELRHFAVAWLLTAIENRPEALVLLDSRQRLIAYSPAMTAFVTDNSLATSISRSWMDIPILSRCGMALVHSLKVPRQTVEARADSHQLRFTTFTDRRLVTAGTWVEVRRA